MPKFLQDDNAEAIAIPPGFLRKNLENKTKNVLKNGW